jgi:uncharacterized sodium:solute symporter family permease YidK
MVGKKEAQLAIAMSLLKTGMSVEQVVSVTGVSMHELMSVSFVETPH